MKEPAVKALAPWAGSKRTIANRIVEAIGPHRAYFVPFCGSMADLLAKPRATMETVNDLHGDLINLARVIRHPKLGPTLYKHLRRTLFAEELANEAIAWYRAEGLRPSVPNEPDWERAAKFAMSAWMGRNGTIGTNAGNNFCVRYTANGGQPATRWRNWVAGIPWFHKRLQGVIILRQDGFAMLERIEDVNGIAIYVDPPYITKSFRYEYDFAEVDHDRLAKALSRFKHARVVVSYYDCPEVDRLYPRELWDRIDCEITKGLAQSGSRGKEGAVKAPEILLVNRPVPGKRKGKPAKVVAGGMFE